MTNENEDSHIHHISEPLQEGITGPVPEPSELAEERRQNKLTDLGHELREVEHAMAAMEVDLAAGKPIDQDKYDEMRRTRTRILSDQMDSDDLNP